MLCLIVLSVLFLSSVISGCTKGDGCKQTEILTDSLNTLAYTMRYGNPDSALYYAQCAYRESGSYDDGRCESLNMQMFCRFLQMNYDEALRLYEQVQQSTNNQIELLVSEVNMMMLCQQTSQNRSFYKYYTRALMRMKRIAEEEIDFSERSRERMSLAETEFHLTAALYYIYMMQEQQATRELEQIDEDGTVRQDKALLCRLHYLKGLSRLRDSGYNSANTLDVFDHFLRAYSIAERNGRMTYLTAMSAQSLAGLLLDDYSRQIVIDTRPAAYLFLRSSLLENDTSGSITPDYLQIPMALVRRGVDDAKLCNNTLLTANGYYVRGNLMFAQKEYSNALADYEMALNYINEHHRICYPDDKSGMLSVLHSDDTVSVDMKWVRDERIQTIPAWLALVRERLSATYAALNNKPESDYHRNIYLDLLDFTRQDKSLESSLEQVEQDNRILNVILTFVIVLAVTLTLFIVFYARMWHKRNLVRSRMLDEVYESLKKNVSDKDGEHLDAVTDTCKWMKPERRLLKEVLQPYMEWRNRNRILSDEMDERRTQSRMELMECKRRIVESKRKNISGRAKISLVYSITPFIDRILHDVRKMKCTTERVGSDTLTYISELTDKINAYNDVLTEWIQMNRGQLELTVESFPIQEVLTLLQKADYSFRKKGLKLTVQPSGAWVKADKAFTFFMINTLADNARKFTPEGGRVSVSARELEDAVEISVEDTGCGLSSEDMELILSSKIYDANKIGRHDEFARQSKGSGFGLMNCKGIIEKYRKAGGMFSVCRFDIESRKGKGSRFSFRLPKGIVRIWCSLILGGTLCSVSLPTLATNSFQSVGQPDEQALKKAVAYADSVYFANINGHYEHTMQMADSALKYINRAYGNALPAECLQEGLDRIGSDMSELEWWNRGADVDYRFIMALRNEIAVAAMALHRWNEYEYNNALYTHMYKLLSQDSSLEELYVRQREIRMNLRMGIAIMIVLLVVFLILIFVIYFRRRLLFRFNVLQVLEIHRSMLHIVARYNSDVATETLLGDLSEAVFSGLKELHETNGVKILFYNNVIEKKETCAKGEIAHPDLTDTRLENCCTGQEEIADHIINTRFYPLKVVTDKGEGICIGAFAVNCGNYTMQQEDVILERYVIGYLSILLYETVICSHRDLENTELAENEKQRAVYEENRLHVQNQILDNCLSTIKHESMYYPSRIKQVVCSIGTEERPEALAEKIHTLTELAEYYKEIYTLLCAQADRQMAADFFKCSTVAVGELTKEWLVRTRRIADRKGIKVVPSLDYRTEEVGIHADKVLADYMLAVLTDEWLCRIADRGEETQLCLSIEEDGKFVRFTLCTPASLFDMVQATGLFYPDTAHYPYLLCKEIIREHEKLNNFCGCRINAETDTNGGCRIWFTLPITKLTNYETI